MQTDGRTDRRLDGRKNERCDRWRDGQTQVNFYRDKDEDREEMYVHEHRLKHGLDHCGIKKPSYLKTARRSIGRRGTYDTSFHNVCTAIHQQGRDRQFVCKSCETHARRCGLSRDEWCAVLHPRRIGHCADGIEARLILGEFYMPAGNYGLYTAFFGQVEASLKASDK